MGVRHYFHFPALYGPYFYYVPFVNFKVGSRVIHFSNVYRLGGSVFRVVTSDFGIVTLSERQRFRGGSRLSNFTVVPYDVSGYVTRQFSSMGQFVLYRFHHLYASSGQVFKGTSYSQFLLCHLISYYSDSYRGGYDAYGYYGSCFPWFFRVVIPPYLFRYGLYVYGFQYGNLFWSLVRSFVHRVQSPPVILLAVLLLYTSKFLQCLAKCMDVPRSPT